MNRRRPSLAVRCVQGVAVPLLLAAVTLAVYGLGHLLLGRR